MIGVDVHKSSHTLVAVDVTGHKIGEKTVQATTDGHLKALGWARTRFGSQLTWGIEDIRGLSRRLEHDLLAAGQRIVRVAPRLTARSRRSGRQRGKSDPIDALAVARVVLREPDLPVACHDEVSRELKLLIDRREDLVGQRTSTINRLRWRIHELDPQRLPSNASLRRIKHRDALEAWLTTEPGLVAELARDELADVKRLCGAIEALQRRTADRVRALTPSLLAVPGCAELSAARIVAEIGDLTRFKSEAHFASYAGVAPMPLWSGRTGGRVMMPISGNRALKTTLHRIALTQVRMSGPGADYYRRRRGEGDTSAAALRCLKRRVARKVYARVCADAKLRTAGSALSGGGQ